MAEPSERHVEEARHLMACPGYMVEREIAAALAAAERRGAEALAAQNDILRARCMAAYQAVGIADDPALNAEDIARLLDALVDSGGDDEPSPAFEAELGRLLPIRCAAAPEPAPMTGADVLRIFRPVPPEEADALHFALGTADGDAAAPDPAADLLAALQFYADEWRGSMIGGGEHHNTYCFQEPTEALMQDAGQRARDALGRQLVERVGQDR